MKELDINKLRREIRIFKNAIAPQDPDSGAALAPSARWLREFQTGFLAFMAKPLQQRAQAYRVLRQERGLPPSRLEAAGYLAPEHRGYLARIESDLARWGLAGEFTYHGALDRPGKVAFLRGLDAFSVPSTYAEPKGLYLLEARSEEHTSELQSH